MIRILRKLFNIREGEGLRAILMFSYVFLIIASLLIVKPVRNSLFLTTFGASQLPYAFILVALFAAVISSVYANFALELRLNALIYYTLLACIVCLVVFWLLLKLQFQAGWFIYAIYVWVAIFGVITTSQFWLLANYTFNSREARRLFGFVGSGAISGGIFGGYLTNYLAPMIGTEDLLLLCAAALGACVFIARLVWQKGAMQSYQEKLARQEKLPQTRTTAHASALGEILKSDHLKYTAILVGIGVIVANLVDYQFSAIASETIKDEDELTAFFGFWLSNLSITSLLIQLFITSRVLKTFGVGASLFFLPVGILVGAVLLLASPVLWAAIFIRVSDGAFKQSIHKAGLELLILPIPRSVKDQTKAFIDVFVDSFATGLGGVLLIVFTSVIGVTTGQVSLVIIALIVGWVYTIFKVRREYINSFRLALEKRTIEVDEPSVSLSDASIFENFQKVLEGKNERQILYVLNLVEDVVDEKLPPLLEKLLDHPSPEVQAKILSMMQAYPETDIAERAEKLTGHADREVRVQAVRYLCGRSDQPASVLDRFLSSPVESVQTAALLCAARMSREEPAYRRLIDFKAIFEQIWRKLRQTEDQKQAEFIKLNAAMVIGVARDAKLNTYLHILLNDASTAVAKAATFSAGETQELEFAPLIIANLRVKHLRKVARDALVAYGDKVVDLLSDKLHQAKFEQAQKIAIPRILGAIKSQKSVNVLLQHLNQNDLIVRSEVIKALNRLKQQMPMLKYDTERVESHILEETESYYQLISYLTAQNGETEEQKKSHTEGYRRARQLLIGALEERLEENLERIFRLLGLRYKPDDMFNAYRGVTSDQNELRANAIEFLDNVLDSQLKKYIIPLVESNSPFSLMNKLARQTYQDEALKKECLSSILAGDDNWLKVCALYLIAEQRNGDCIGEIGVFLSDPDPMVQETAQLAMRKLKLSN